MSTPSTLSEERLDALLRGEGGHDESERRISAILAELRADAPPVPEALRERIAGLTDPEPVRPRRAWLTWRRGLLALAPAAVVVGLGAAVVQGIVSASSDGPSALRAGGGDSGTAAVGRARDNSSKRAFEAYRPARGFPFLQEQDSGATGTALSHLAQPIPPSRRRLQAYDAYLRVKVPDIAALSRTTSQAMRLTRGYGGFVASVRYDTPGGKRGDATLRLRIPIARVQEAVVRFSQLGTILAQSFGVSDLQGQFNSQTGRIDDLQRQIARLNRRLSDTTLTGEARARLQAQLGFARQDLARFKEAQRQTVRRGRLAQVSLSLTTRAEIAPQADETGRVGRALDDAGAILAKEVAWALYALIVVGPLLLFLGLLWLAARFVRRHSDRVLLERL